MDLDDRVVHVNQRALINTAHQGRGSGEPAQEPGGYRVELADVAERERPQERAQRRGRIRTSEDLAHRAVAQHRHVVDAVRASDHPRHQRSDLRTRVRALVGGHAQMLIGQPAKAC